MALKFSLFVLLACVDASPNVTSAAAECPVCSGGSPTIWPFSGCPVSCGAKVGDTCCTIEPKPCPICSCSKPTVWPFSGCRATCGASCGGECCCIKGVGKCGSSRAKHPLKKYVVNLDLAPEERFVEIARDHKHYYHVLRVVLEKMFGDETSKHFLDTVVVPNETQRELQGIAKTLGVPYKTALIGEYYYELSMLKESKGIAMAACTGIIAQGSDGTIYHGRNQDYPPPFSPMQYQATFMRDGKAIFEATNFAGIASIGGTCMTHGGFSVEINAREESVVLDKAQFLRDAAAGRPSVEALLRQACTRGGSFEEAVTFLAETPALGASNYYIVAGTKPGEGAIIARNASGTDSDVQRLSQGYPSDAPWYLIQTNYDRWDKTVHPAPILPAIFSADLRRESGMQLMSQQNPETFNLDELWSVMSDTGTSTGVKWGIYNQATIHTELMIPATGEYYSYSGHNVIMTTNVIV